MPFSAAFKTSTPSRRLLALLAITVAALLHCKSTSHAALKDETSLSSASELTPTRVTYAGADGSNAVITSDVDHVAEDGGAPPVVLTYQLSERVGISSMSPSSMQPAPRQTQNIAWSAHAGINVVTVHNALATPKQIDSVIPYVTAAVSDTSSSDQLQALITAKDTLSQVEKLLSSGTSDAEVAAQNLGDDHALQEAQQRVAALTRLVASLKPYVQAAASDAQAEISRRRGTTNAAGGDGDAAGDRDSPDRGSDSDKPGASAPAGPAESGRGR